MDVCYTVIGIIHSKLREKESTPIQGCFSTAKGFIELFPACKEGLEDLEGFSHLFLLYHFHEAGTPKLRIRPFLDWQERGIFATRHPDRPNPIGLSIVELLSIEDTILQIRGVDILDGTPLLDIKPYVPHFDIRDPARCGWLDEANLSADGAKEYTPATLHQSAPEDGKR
jgi:tRNA-Thr(GGU) m(6)t(6)A37 methyltransferase TsaA